MENQISKEDEARMNIQKTIEMNNETSKRLDKNLDGLRETLDSLKIFD